MRLEQKHKLTIPLECTGILLISTKRATKANKRHSLCVV